MVMVKSVLMLILLLLMVLVVVFSLSLSLSKFITLLLPTARLHVCYLNYCYLSLQLIYYSLFVSLSVALYLIHSFILSLSLSLSLISLSFSLSVFHSLFLSLSIFFSSTSKLQSSSLLEASCWNNIVDFRWHRNNVPSPHWYVLPVEERQKELSADLQQAGWNLLSIDTLENNSKNDDIDKNVEIKNDVDNLNEKEKNEKEEEAEEEL